MSGSADKGLPFLGSQLDESDWSDSRPSSKNLTIRIRKILVGHIEIKESPSKITFYFKFPLFISVTQGSVEIVPLMFHVPFSSMF
jgi:hypothetical protein